MIFLLNRKEKMIGVFNNATPSSCPYFDDLHTENLVTGVNTYDFSVPANHPTASQLETDGYVIRRDLDDKLQMFQIKEVYEINTMTGYVKEVQTEHIAVPDLLGNPVRPAVLLSATLETALEYILQGTGWELGEVDFTESKDVKFEDYTNVLDALLYVIALFEVEVQYEVVFQGGEVKKKLIHATTERGRRTMKRFSYSKDLSDVKRRENTEGLVTALIGVGRGDADGKRLTLEGYNYPTPSPFEKPVEVDWIGDNDALQKYGKNGKHIFGVFFDETAENVHNLYEHTLAELKKRNTPLVTYEVSVVTLERITGYESEKVRIGDTITVDDYSFNPRLSLEARVIEVKRSYTNPDADEITLGNYRPIAISRNSTIESIQKLISKAEEKWNTSAYKVEIISSNGLIFKSGFINTTLEARVFQGTKDVTDVINASNFKWKRISNDTASDDAWNTANAGGVKFIHITTDDVRQRATFTCEVDI